MTASTNAEARNGDPSTSDASASIEIRGLTLGYGNVTVLADSDLDVARSTVAAVLGPSGAGKSTLLRAIAGFVQPQAGTIRLNGELVCGDGTYVPPERRSIGLVPQEGALFPHLNVAGNVGFGLPRRTKADREAADERIDELLKLVSLPNAHKLQPHELSGGMQQRVALARALARRPRTVLLDEPFSALDAQLRRELRMQVRELLIGTGAGIVLVTHDEDEAAAMADEIHLVVGSNPGRLVAQEHVSD